MQTRLLERFLRYVAVTSQSDASQAVVPSTEGQRSLAELLKKDLAELGLVNLEISEYSVLTGKLPANLPAGSGEQVPAVGFVAHLDTVDVNLSADIKPQVVRSYSGGDICLNEKKGIYLREAEHPELLKYKGQDIVCTDGTSVLGADNKAAIANVPVAFAYTIDCCELGEVVYETFNAGSAVVKIKGVSAHPMSAKGVMVNPTLVAVDLINSFDRMQTPEHTEGTEGYIWAKSIISNQSEAVVQLDIRDHNKNTYEARKHLIKTNVESLQKLYPRAEIVCTITDTYGNIADAVNDENRKCIDYIYTAMSELGIKPNTIAMRGGTDGSYISTQGILTPNYFTGGHNFHSNCEFLPLLALEKSCQMTLKLIELIAKG